MLLLMCSRKGWSVDRMSTPLFSALRKRRLGRPAIHCHTLASCSHHNGLLVIFIIYQEFRRIWPLKTLHQKTVVSVICSYPPLSDNVQKAPYRCAQS